MNSFEKLIQIFEEFPGIGPRQARRFVYFLLAKNPDFISEFGKAVGELKNEILRCEDCFRYFPKKGGDGRKCSICEDGARDPSFLILVSKDSDLLAIEKSGGFQGFYFVLGGLIPILEKNPERRIRGEDLKRIIEKRKKEGLKEIILAFSATHDGENTSIFLEEFLNLQLKTYNLKLSHLGRGLSTGSELEYADKDTIKAALENKK